MFELRVKWGKSSTKAGSQTHFSVQSNANKHIEVDVRKPVPLLKTFLTPHLRNKQK